MKDSKKELKKKLYESSIVVDDLCYEMDNLRDTYCELMNEEEKKAVEELKEFIQGPCEICRYCSGAYRLNRKNIIQSLNLIEKLQKENEELKNENKTLEQILYDNLYELYKYKYHPKLANTYERNSISVQEVKDLKDRILKNEEYTVVLEGDKEFPDSTTEATFEKYINLKVLDKLIERRK